MRISEVKNQQTKVSQVRKFAAWAMNELGIIEMPTIKYGNDLGHVKKNRTFGSTRSNGDIWVHVGNRNVADICRTLCHELVHHSQFERGTAYDGMDDEQTQKIEDEANSIAGRMMRVYGKKDETIYEGRTGSLQQDVADSLPATYAIPELPNQDPYLQYRFGVAIAGAKGRAQREKDGVAKFTEKSAWGENLIVVSYDPDIDKYIDDALEQMGLRGKRMISTQKSEEASDVGKVSPVATFKNQLNTKRGK